MDISQERRKRDLSPAKDDGIKSQENGERRKGGHSDDNINRRRRYEDRDDNSGLVYFVYGDMKENDRDKEAYVDTLKRELLKLDDSCVQIRRLVEAEITRIQDVKTYPQDHIQLHRDRLIKLSAKVAVPVHEYPQVSFLGRIFGPGGENLKNLCRQTRAKIGLFGAGCTKNPEKEKEMLKRNDPQYDHLNEPLHLYIETIGFPAEAYARVAHVMNEARKFMDPYYPGITNMKAEDIKRLIQDQRRLNESNNRNNNADPSTDSAPDTQKMFQPPPPQEFGGPIESPAATLPYHNNNTNLGATNPGISRVNSTTEPEPMVSRAAIDRTFNALKQPLSSSSTNNSAPSRRMSPPPAPPTATHQQQQPPPPPPQSTAPPPSQSAANFTYSHPTSASTAAAPYPPSPHGQMPQPPYYSVPAHIAHGGNYGQYPSNMMVDPNMQNAYNISHIMANPYGVSGQPQLQGAPFNGGNPLRAANPRSGGARMPYNNNMSF